MFLVILNLFSSIDNRIQQCLSHNSFFFAHIVPLECKILTESIDFYKDYFKCKINHHENITLILSSFSFKNIFIDENNHKAVTLFK